MSSGCIELVSNRRTQTRCPATDSVVKGPAVVSTIAAGAGVAAGASAVGDFGAAAGATVTGTAPFVSPALASIDEVMMGLAEGAISWYEKLWISCFFPPS